MAEENKNIQSEKAVNVIKNLVVRKARVDYADIQTWKDALAHFGNGYGVKLYDLYDNLLADPVLFDAVEKRVEAVTNAEITFQLDGSNIEEIDDLIDTPEFEELIREIVLSKAFGKSVIEVGFSPEFWCYSIPRQHLRTNYTNLPLRDRQKIIVSMQGEVTGYEYKDDPFIWEIGKDNEAGFIFKAAQYVIYKRGGFGDWAQFAEIFGMPFVTARYDGQDTEQRDQVFEAMSLIGSHPYAAVPQGAEIEVHDNKSSGSTNLFDTFRKACNEEILIAVLGNTMTTVDGSSRSQAEVHREQQKNKAQSDRRFVQRILNRYMVPMLVRRGYKVAGGFFLFPDLGENMTVNERVDLGLKLKSAGIPVADNYFYEITGIPEAEKDDPKPKDDSKNNNKDEKLHDSHPPLPTGDGLGFPCNFFVDAPTMRSGAKPSLKAKLKRLITGKIALADDFSIDINKLINRAIRELYNEAHTPPPSGGDGGGAPVLNKNLFNITNNALQAVITKEMTTVRDDEFINQLRNNTAVFSAFKNHQQTKEIVSLLIDEDGKALPFYKFKKLALQVSEKYNVQWLRTEYNTAIRAARQAANYMRYLETEHLYPNLEYMHTSASNPREKHLDFVGTILPIRHPWWKRNLPPNGWNCQCWVQPTDKEATTVPDGDIDPVFQNNAANSAELIKTKETPYYTNTDEALCETVEKIGLEYQEEYEPEHPDRYIGKKGGYLDEVAQSGNEAVKNKKTYRMLADRGHQYALLKVINIDNVKNPDAFNIQKGCYSDAKHPETKNGKAAIQNSIKEASDQKVKEVVIRLEHKYPSNDIYNGLKAAFQQDRAKSIETVILIRKNSEPLYLDAKKLRERFYKK